MIVVAYGFFWGMLLWTFFSRRTFYDKCVVFKTLKRGVSNSKRAAKSHKQQYIAHHKPSPHNVVWRGIVCTIHSSTTHTHQMHVFNLNKIGNQSTKNRDDGIDIFAMFKPLSLLKAVSRAFIHAQGKKGGGGWEGLFFVRQCECLILKF